jgi:hypothetical protein
LAEATTDAAGHPAGLVSNCTPVHAFCRAVNRQDNCLDRYILIRLVRRAHPGPAGNTPIHQCSRRPAGARSTRATAFATTTRPSPMVRFPLAPGEGLNTSFADGTFTCPERPLTPQCGRPLIPSRRAQPRRVPQQRQLRTPNPSGDPGEPNIQSVFHQLHNTPDTQARTRAREAQVRQPGHHRPPPANSQGTAT